MSRIVNVLCRSIKSRLLPCTYNKLSLRLYSSTTGFGGRLFSKQRCSLSTKHLFTIEAKMSTQQDIKVINYEGVKELKNNREILLIDVREPTELQNTGILPGSINIPLGEVENILQNMPADKFLQHYGRPKPDFNFPLVFSCQAGRRSLMASQTALKLGFKDVTNYSGGWLDWEANIKASN